MAEWFKAAVLKTVDGETRPGVRIPLPPPVVQLFSVFYIPVGALAPEHFPAHTSDE